MQRRALAALIFIKPRKDFGWCGNRVCCRECARSRADDDANRGNHERSSLFRLRFCARALIASWTLVPSSTSGMSLIAPYTRAKTDPKRKSQIMAHRGPMPTSFAQM